METFRNRPKKRNLYIIRQPLQSRKMANYPIHKRAWISVLTIVLLFKKGKKTPNCIPT